ncbi:HNH endonuclease signature motif containing protein [Escherichia coli]
MKNNQIKFEYIKSHWYLDEGVIYSQRTHMPISFSCKSSKNKHRFAMVNLAGGIETSICIHDAIWMMHHNRPLPDGKFEVHHVDGNILNNNPSNLVLMSNRMHRLYHRYIAGAKGYYYNAQCLTSPWKAQVHLPIGRRITKSFATEAEAQAFVAYHRAPIIKAFKQLGLPV